MENTSFAASNTAAVNQELLSGSEDFLEFYSEFEKQFDNLKDALKNTKRTKELAASLREKGAMKNFLGSFSGRNDKELAHMVEDLGASMETTQVILQLLMKVQNTKNQFLRVFHKALVDKIAFIQNDTTTLDANQRQIAITVVSELRNQIEEQIAQQAIVENHQKKLQQLDGYIVQKDVLDQEQSQKISLLESRALQIIRVDEEQQRLIEALKAAHASKDEVDRIQTQRLDSVSTAVIDLEVEVEKHRRTVDLLEKQLNLTMQQLRTLDVAISEQRTPRAIVLRNLLPSAAFLISLLALLVNIR